MTSMLIGALIGGASGYLSVRLMMLWFNRSLYRDLAKWRAIDRECKDLLKMQEERRSNIENPQ